MLNIRIDLGIPKRANCLSFNFRFLSEEYAEPTVDEARLYFRENPATFQTMLSALGFNALTLEQCRAAREFSRTVLRGFLVAAPAAAARAD